MIQHLKSRRSAASEAPSWKAVLPAA